MILAILVRESGRESTSLCTFDEIVRSRMSVRLCLQSYSTTKMEVRPYEERVWTTGKPKLMPSISPSAEAASNSIIQFVAIGMSTRVTKSITSTISVITG